MKEFSCHGILELSPEEQATAICSQKASTAHGTKKSISQSHRHTKMDNKNGAYRTRFIPTTGIWQTLSLLHLLVSLYTTAISQNRSGNIRNISCRNRIHSLAGNFTSKPVIVAQQEMQWQKDFLNKIYLSVWVFLPVCISVTTWHEVPKETRRGYLILLEMEGPYCRPQFGCWKSNPGPMEKTTSTLNH